ncbi:MAG: glycosyltransferase [Verrucomicrobiota bacterium]
MVIYHHAAELGTTHNVASSLRPSRMRAAFEAIGEDVFEVTGGATERFDKAKELAGEMNTLPEGTIFYSESVNTPMALSWLVQEPLRWRDMDFDTRLMGRLRARGIPTGLFYRDIYWKFGVRTAAGMRGWVKQAVNPFFARRELRAFGEGLDVLFLPHERMAEYLPELNSGIEVRSLFPGGDAREEAPGDEMDEPGGRGLRLLYVGDIAPPVYDMRPYLDELEGMGDVRLDLITRERELAAYDALYRFGERARVVVSHAEGSGLARFYRGADMAVVVREDCDYHAFGMPVKIFEAISFAVPLMVSAGAKSVVELVRREKIGWVVENPGEFRELLMRLSERPEEIEERRARMLEIRSDHTWEARAREVLAVLRGVEGQH